MTPFLFLVRHYSDLKNIRVNEENKQSTKMIYQTDIIYDNNIIKYILNKYVVNFKLAVNLCLSKTEEY